MASLYPKSGSSTGYSGLGTLSGGGGGGGGGAGGFNSSAYGGAASASYAPSSYGSDPLSLYGSYNPIPPPGVSWPPLDPLFPSLKRPGDEVLYGEDALSKRARIEMAPTYSLYPQRPGEKDCVYYMRTRTCNFGPNCKFDHPAWVPAGGIPDWKEVSSSVPKAQSLPLREGEPDCTFYIKTGNCKFGSNCKFNHPENRLASSTDSKATENANGSSKTAPSSVDGITKPASGFNAKGLPMRPGETECSFYMKTGSCKFGSACRFDHPEKPASMALQQSQAPLTPLLGSFSAPYGNYSIFQGAMSDYNFSLPGADFGLSGLTQAPIYPQRPGEQTCSFYMKTGVCKFSNTCKFHHPIDRKEPTTKVTLAGLPRREGEQACPFYMKTGTCKFATTCKFDHPPPGEAAAKALAEAGKGEPPEVGEVR